jgi:hypothetical protein
MANALSGERRKLSSRTSARTDTGYKKTAAITFRFEPSASDGRYNVSIEMGMHPYVKFGEVLTRREVQALIECLNLGLRGEALRASTNRG